MRWPGRVAVVGTVAMAAIAGSAHARPPYYPHKAGVAEDALVADETACLTDANQAMKDPKFAPAYAYNPVTQGTVAGAAGAGFAAGLAAGIESAKRFNTTYYDCLTARGYSMHRMSAEDWKMVKKLPKEERGKHVLVWQQAAEPAHPALTRDDID